MIGRLRGIILEKKPPQILLEAGGVGYEISMPMTCFFRLPDTGQEAAIFTHFIVREDAQQLYGFTSNQEKNLFRELIKVNGVGPKLALAILSGMSAPQFIQAVQTDNLSALTRLPGIGKKTAERLIIEMRDRLATGNSELIAPPPDASLPPATANSALAEAEAALVALGYKPQEASRMISKIAAPDASSETLIREALRLAL